MQNEIRTGRVRRALREATMASHERVDTLFADFAFDSPSDYAAFLSAHARALVPLEAAAEPDASRLLLLAADLAGLGRAMPPPLSMPDLDGKAQGAAFRWGLRYALEGSRLGGAMLARKVTPGMPLAYLSARHGKGDWAAFQVRLDAAAASDPVGEDGFIADAVRGAQAAFDLFAAAGEAERPVARG